MRFAAALRWLPGLRDLLRRAHSDSPGDQESARALLALVYAQSSTAASGTLLCSVFIASLFWRHLSPLELLVWLTGSTLVLAHRIVVTHRFRTLYESRPPGYWLRYIHLSVLASGGIWGMLLAHLIASVEPGQLAIPVIVLCMLVSGATLAYAQLLSVLISYAAPLSLPTVLALAWGVDGAELPMVAGFLIWILFMARGGLRLNAFIVRYVNFQHENLALTANLEREKSQVLALNDELQEKVGTLVLTRATLRKEKEKAEELSAQLLLLSSRDSLTGLANRREFDRVIASEWQRAGRAGNALTVILIDVDYFKNFNDTYGHQAGDNCLREIARVIQDCCRRSRDLAARIGGEEFAVLLPETSVGDAEIQAQRLRRSIEALEISHSQSACAAVITASFGVASEIATPGRPCTVLIEQADRALYQAKSLARNRVVTAPSSRAPRLPGATVKIGAPDPTGG